MLIEGVVMSLGLKISLCLTCSCQILSSESEFIYLRTDLGNLYEPPDVTFEIMSDAK